MQNDLNEITAPSELASKGFQVRYGIIAISVAMAFMLYLDRVCLGEIVKNASFQDEFGASKESIGRVLGAFFFSYALFQIPAGWLSDRYGARITLTTYILAWSILTGITGFASSLTGLLIARLACGVAQAGAYPTSGGLIRNWYPTKSRGIASGWVSMGGRIGGTTAPYLTALLVWQLSSWRSVLYVYCWVGVVVAIGYYWVIRNTPDEHPLIGADELRAIGHTPDPVRPTLTELWPLLWACCCNRSLWLNSLAQLSTNIGWVFLITWLPTYLSESKGVDPLKGALMVSIVLAVGIPGQLIGGLASDIAVRRFGLRIGRVITPAIASSIAGLAYFACLGLDSVWAIVFCCAVVSMMTDIGNPSIWAFMQDIGGRNTAAIYGWANMWGNFGASFGSLMVPTLLTWGQSSGSGQAMVFIACGSAFFVSAVAMLGMDATRPIESKR